MRKALFWTHLVVGLIAGLVILIMSVTGVLLMYQRQITNWADGTAVSPPSASAERLSAGTILAKVLEAEKTPPTAITFQSDPRSAASVSFGREKTLFINPYTGEILGEGSKAVRAFFRVMIDWHRWLGMQGENRPIGKAITGASNLGFLFLVLSGLYLWWPRRWNARSLKAVLVFDRGLKGKARDWNWHNVIGFWSAVPLAILVFTAIFFSYPWATEWLYRATGEEPPARPAPRAAPASGGAPARNSAETPRENRDAERPSIPSGINRAWEAAAAHVDGWRSISLRYPASPTAPLVFTIDRGNGARPDLRGQLTVNAGSAAIEKWEPYESQSAARKIRLWVRWLHTGEAGGWIGQTIAGVASAGGAVLVWTGVSLALRRFFKRRDPAVTARVQPENAMTP